MAKNSNFVQTSFITFAFFCFYWSCKNLLVKIIFFLTLGKTERSETKGNKLHPALIKQIFNKIFSASLALYLKMFHIQNFSFISPLFFHRNDWNMNFAIILLKSCTVQSQPFFNAFKLQFNEMNCHRHMGLGSTCVKH